MNLHTVNMCTYAFCFDIKPKLGATLLEGSVNMSHFTLLFWPHNQLISINLWMYNKYKFVLLSLSAQELRGLGYKKGKPLGLVGVTELSDDQKRQIKEQQEVQKCQINIFINWKLHVMTQSHHKFKIFRPCNLLVLLIVCVVFSHTL